MFDSSRNLKLASVVFAVAFCISTILGGLEYSQSKNQWSIKIDNKLINSTSSSSSMINLEHEFGNQMPNSLTVKINDIEGRNRVE